ncbi:hypothetical protein BC834DRAFT_898040 [Gloeopeniophorella convolvens]|nr:hypothetical protein BC834DRAFT_898040 [Gloeopeniophorella convolvens]
MHPPSKAVNNSFASCWIRQRRSRPGQAHTLSTAYHGCLGHRAAGAQGCLAEGNTHLYGKLTAKPSCYSLA